MRASADHRALLIAFHFPPMQGSSGLQRTLGFARHLPACAWTPIVLSARPGAYPSVDESQAGLLPKGLTVVRAFCLDTARHLAFRGRYPGFLAVPDRWISWVPAAVVVGLRAVRRYRPDVIWSTYPLASSHIVGRILSGLTNIPWIADFRDPMVEQNPRTGAWAPPDPKVRATRLKIEKACVEKAAALVFCTDWARDICTSRHAASDNFRFHVISNGYEESSFQAAEKALQGRPKTADASMITLLHSGTIYPTADRDPRPFFDAVAALKQENGISGSTLRVILRATGHDDQFRSLLTERDISDIVRLEPPLPYVEALAEMLSVDGLILFQGYTSNPAIPAKLYEYLRARKPILALVDESGSTVQLLRELATGTSAPIENVAAIRTTLQTFIAKLAGGEHPAHTSRDIRCFSREHLTGELAAVFDGVLR